MHRDSLYQKADSDSDIDSDTEKHDTDQTGSIKINEKILHFLYPNEL